MTQSLKEETTTKNYKAKKSRNDIRKLNMIKNSLSIKFTNTTILHWQAGENLTFVSNKIQPTTKQKKYNKL